MNLKTSTDDGIYNTEQEDYFNRFAPSVTMSYPTYSPRLHTPPLLFKKFKVVLCIYTGGTIGMKMTSKGYSPDPGYLTKYVRTLPMFHDQSAEHIIPASARKHYPGMSAPFITPITEYGERVVMRILEYNPLLDSSNVTYKEWSKIANDIVKYYDEFDSFVVLHGTDTMAFTASALSFMLENLGKTVCITGSQIPLCRPRNDGIMNFLSAISIAGQFDIPEVVLYFGFQLYRGNRTSKMDANGLSAFDSPNLPPLAKVGVNIKINWGLVRPSSHKRLVLKDHFCNDITLLRIYPGPFNTLEHTLKNVKGLVLQTFGSGNAPELPKFLAILKKYSDEGVVILNCTQCIKGDVQPHYAAGTALRESGVISCGDMTPEAALIKLGWLLGSGMGSDEVREKIQADLRGEKKNLDEDVSFNMNDRSFAKAVYTVLKRQHSSLLRANVSGANNLLSRIDTGLLPPVICNFAASGAINELNDIFENRNNENFKTLSPDICDYDKRTGLHVAAANNQYDVVNFFIEQGADVNCKDSFGRTPMREAVENNHIDIILLLKENGAKIGLPDSKIASRLCSVIKNNNKENLASWIKCGINVNVRDYAEHTPLMIASAGNDVEVVKILLKEGANPTMKTNFNNTALTFALNGSKNPEIIDLLKQQVVGSQV